MKINMKFEVEPFRTPNYVLSKEKNNVESLYKWHVSDVSPEVLVKLCDRFRKDIFKKAGIPEHYIGGREDADDE